MQKHILLGLAVLLLALGASAQTTVTTSGGSTNSVPKFSGGSTLVNSAITEVNGNVGIGTNNPQQALHIVGDNSAFAFGSSVFSSPNGNFIGGELGTFTGIGGSGNAIGALFFQRWLGWATDYSNAIVGQDPDNQDLIFRVGTTATAGDKTIPERMRIANSGNVGIGTTTPGAKLEVDGNLKLTASSGASITFQDGTVQTTAFNGVTCGGDYAESVDVTGDRTHYEPGDLLVIDTAAPGKFLKSAEAYSTIVAGIYSTKPGLVGRRQTTDATAAKEEVPMAMVGIVPTKVSAENGPIHTGDLLVTSTTLGHAMRGSDAGRMLGAVVGKALGNLDSGTGVIEVLVTLQ